MTQEKLEAKAYHLYVVNWTKYYCWRQCGFRYRDKRHLRYMQDHQELAEKHIRRLKQQEGESS